MKDDGVFIYCLPKVNSKGFCNPYSLRIVSAHAARKCKEFWTVSASFISKITKTGVNSEEVELIPALEWLSERQQYYFLQEFKIFSNFRINKAFVTWKLNVRRNKTENSKTFLYKHLFYADEFFQGCLLQIKELCEDALSFSNKKYKDDPPTVCFVKLEHSRTYSLDEFYEEQVHQSMRARKQLEVIKEKAIVKIKNTILQVSEKKDVKEYFEEKPSPLDSTHFKLPELRRLLETNRRFLVLVDYLFQELVRQLTNTAVAQLLEFFSSSDRVPFSVEKKNENLIRTLKDEFFQTKDIKNSEELTDSSTDKEHGVKVDANTNKILNSSEVEKTLRKMCAPIFEVNLCLRIPESEPSENFEDNIDDADLYLICEGDEISEDEDNLVKSCSSADLLLEANKLQTVEPDIADTDVTTEYENKHMHKVPEFPTNLFIQPNRLEFSIKIQNLIANIENCITSIIPFHQDPRLSRFIDIISMMDPSHAENIMNFKKQTNWPDCQILFETDPVYQDKIVNLLTLIGNSMSLVSVYSFKFLKFCTMVEKAKVMNMKISSVGHLSSAEFKIVLHKFKTYFRHIVTMVTEKRIGIFNVVSLNFQSECLPYIDNVIQTSNNLLRSVIEKKNADLLEVVESSLQKLECDPNEIEEFVDYFTFLEEMSIEISNLEKEYLTISQLYSVVKHYHIDTADEQKALYKVISMKIIQLKTALKLSATNRETAIAKFRNNLEARITGLRVEVSDLKAKIRTPVLLCPHTRMAAAMEMIRSLTEEAASLTHKAKMYSSYQDHFDKSRSHMQSLNMEEVTRLVLSEITDIECDLTLRKILWEAQDEWVTLFREWKKCSLQSLDVDLVQRTVSKWLHVIFVLEKGLPKNDAVSHLKQSVMDFKQELPIIIALGNPCLRPRHWEALQEVIGRALDKNCSVENVLALKMFQHESEISEISNSATNEDALEKMLFKIIDLWNTTPLHLVSHHSESYSILVISSVDDILVQLEESQVILATIKGSPYLEPIKDLVHKWDNNLNLFSYTLGEWMNCQRSWLYLEPIFHSLEIQRQLPEETKHFSMVLSMWKELMSKVQNKLEALRITTSAGVLEVLQSCNAYLDSIKRSLEDYLEVKRMIFPRFYFLSNAELLNILANSRNPQSVQLHLVKCFENIKEVLICKEEIGPPAVKMLISAEGEGILLPKKIRIRSAVEQWLVNIEKSMFDAVRKFVNQGVEDWTQQDFPLWVVSHPGQVVLTVSHIMFHNDCNRSFMSPNPIEELEKVHIGVICHLKEIAELIGLSTNNSRTKIVLEALVTHFVHSRDIVMDLLLKNIISVEDFEWTRHLQYKWDEKQKLCYVTQGDASFSYGCEYLGCSRRLVVTPLTDRCWLTFLGALSLHLGGCTAGPAGVGKTETVKDLAKALGKHCVLFSCFEDLDYKVLGRFFYGLVQSGAWCCFDEFNLLDVEVLSVIASQILEIKAAKDNYSIRFVLDGKDMRLNMSCAVFITINPSYGGRVELPDNLKALFRPMIMTAPNFQIITEVILFSFGFKSAKLLSEKVVHLYELASKQLSPQDHYDFGMRSLKRVLVMTEKKKQEFKRDGGSNCCEADETLIVIQAVREASLPGFLPEDVPLFEKIIGDVFPEVKVSKENLLSLEKAIYISTELLGFQQWPCQKEKIIQFYIQLQACVGVMLVGPTGGGKTAARKILKKALILLPIIDTLSITERRSITKIPGKKGKVDTCVLNPKCVSLGELFGHLDPNTMEWRDGLLSATIRGFVYSDSGKFSGKRDEPEPMSKSSGLTNVFQLESSDTTDTDRLVVNTEKNNKILEDHNFDWQWLVLDGPVDILWVETLNSVLDDTRTLCLANSERIALTSTVRLIFEVDTLSKASPATISRCAMVYMDPVDLGWEPYVQSWLLRKSTIMSQSGVDCLQLLIKKSVPEGLRFMKKHQKHQPFPVQGITAVTTLCRILDAFFDFMITNGGLGQSNQKDKKDAPAKEAKPLKIRLKDETRFSYPKDESLWFLEKNPDKLALMLQKLFVFAFTWAFGGSLQREDEHEEDTIFHTMAGSKPLAEVTYNFSRLVREIFEHDSHIELGIHLPVGDRSVFGYFVDIQQCEFTPWSELVPTVQTLIQKGTSLLSDLQGAGRGRPDGVQQPGSHGHQGHHLPGLPHEPPAEELGPRAAHRRVRCWENSGH
ncbi:dynein axonemal heavy chain 14 [Thomomys bottae]